MKQLKQAMDDFQNIDFDTVEGVIHEVHTLTSRIMGIMDHLDDPSMNNLPDSAQREVKHVTDALDEANDTLLSGVNSWLNAMWHDMPHTDQVQLLSAEPQRVSAIEGEWLRLDAAAIIAADMMECDNPDRFMVAWKALIYHGGWDKAWRYIRSHTAWEDPQEFLDVLSEWHPEGYSLINEEEITEAHGDWEDE